MSRPSAASAPAPTGSPQPQHHLDDVAHRQPPDRAPLRGRQRGHEPDRALRRAGRLQHAERQRDQRGARPQARRRATEGAARRDLDAGAPAPADAGDDGREAKRARDARDRRREVLQQAVVTVAHAVQRIAPLRLGRLGLLDQAARRDARRVRGVESLDEADHHPPRLRRQAPREFAPPQQVRHADVFVRQVVEHGHRLPPQRLRAADAAPARALVALRVDTQARARGRQRLHEVRRPAVHELGPRLDGGGPARQSPRVDAAADARARFEHDHAQPRPHEPAGRFQARGAGADDDDVRVAVSSSRHVGKHARL